MAEPFKSSHSAYFHVQQQPAKQPVANSSHGFPPCANDTMTTSNQPGSLSLSLPGQLGSLNRSSNAPALRDFFVKNNNGDHRMRLNVAPLGPFTGYSSILKSSKFLKPAQEVLECMCRGCDGFPDILPPEFALGSEIDMNTTFSSVSDKMGCGGKSSKIVLMLDEVYRRYSIYCQQMQLVITSFGAVAGLGNAAPFLSCAIKVVSKNFTNLKNNLLDQIRCTSKPSADSNHSRDGHGTTDSRSFVTNQDSAMTMRFLQSPVWRSQRGLPDHAVAVLKTWLFEHFLHPYPTDVEKQNLAQQTGLSRTQVSNWFINARVRLWKPMVEEVHMLESQQAQSHQQTESNLYSGELSKSEERSQNKRYKVELSRGNSRPQETECSFSLALALHQNDEFDFPQSQGVNITQNPNFEMFKMADNSDFRPFFHH